MKDLLKNLLDAKSGLFKAQKEFKKALKERYHYLIDENTEDIRKDINNELELLLSSSTRLASTRIEIPSKGIGYNEASSLVLTRKPGLKRPHESYSSIDFTEIDEIDKNGDLRILPDPTERNDKEGFVKLSFLKTSGNMKQDRLISFYSFLKETVALSKEFKTFVSYHHWSDDQLPKVKCGDHLIQLDNQGFELHIKNYKAKTAYEEWNKIESSKLTNYDPNEFEEEEDSDDLHEPLTTMLAQFEIFDEVLLTQNERKKVLMQKAEDLRNRLLEFNKPYKILKKLLISS